MSRFKSGNKGAGAVIGDGTRWLYSQNAALGLQGRASDTGLSFVYVHPLTRRGNWTVPESALARGGDWSGLVGA